MIDLIIVCVAVAWFLIGLYRMYRKEQYREMLYAFVGLSVLVIAYYTQYKYHWIPAPDSSIDW